MLEDKTNLGKQEERLEMLSESMDNASIVWGKYNTDPEVYGVIFTYRNTDVDNEKGLYQVIVKKSCHNNYCVSLVTSKYSTTLTNLPKTFIETELISELSYYNINSLILENFKQVIKNLN